ncbi:MAG: zf-HC2 domain-containing protein [Terracidiphilus sp.]
MSTAMNVTGHHEIHPGAEMLSAFVELALSEKERGEVLKHLAVCGRCRQVVALAREAADAGIAAARHEVVQPRAWWTSWGLVLAPAAAVAATTAIAVYVHERDVERRADVAKLEQQQAIEKAPVLPQVPPQPLVQSAPPAAPRSAPARSQKTERTAAARPMSVAEPDETAAAPPPVVINGLFSSHEGPSATPGFERHRTAGEALSPTGAAPDHKMPAEAAVYDEERKKPTEEAEERHQFAAKAPVSSREHDSGSGAGGNGEPVDLSAQQVEPQPARTAGYLQLHELRSMVDAGTGPNAFHLPSGLPAISIAFADHRMLAIDEAGTLFLSKDSGGTWDKVERQWTGRVVAVRRHADGIDTMGATPAPETAGHPAGSGSASQPNTVFELVNDQSQVWISLDGRIWTAK